MEHKIVNQKKIKNVKKNLTTFTVSHLPLQNQIIPTLIIKY